MEYQQNSGHFQKPQVNFVFTCHWCLSPALFHQSRLLALRQCLYLMDSKSPVMHISLSTALTQICTLDSYLTVFSPLKISLALAASISSWKSTRKREEMGIICSKGPKAGTQT